MTNSRDRRWYSYSLRTLFVVATLLGLACFVLSWMWHSESPILVLKRGAAGKTLIYRGGRPVDELELKQGLRTQQPKKEQVIIVRADSDVPYSDVVRLTAMAAELGYRVSLESSRGVPSAAP